MEVEVAAVVELELEVELEELEEVEVVVLLLPLPLLLLFFVVTLAVGVCGADGGRGSCRSSTGSCHGGSVWLKRPVMRIALAHGPGTSHGLQSHLSRLARRQMITSHGRTATTPVLRPSLAIFGFRVQGFSRDMSG